MILRQFQVFQACIKPYGRLVTDFVLRDFPRNTGIWRKYPVLTPYYGDFPPNLHIAGEIPGIYYNFAMAVWFCEYSSCNNLYSALFSCLLVCFYFRSIVLTLPKKKLVHFLKLNLSPRIWYKFYGVSPFSPWKSPYITPYFRFFFHPCISKKLSDNSAIWWPIQHYHQGRSLNGH